MPTWPKVVIVEEGMREGMQIESADISVDDKVRLLDALSQTGLSNIVVGSFVSPKWTPQMAQVDEIVQRFTPREGVRYSALALNERGRERMAAYRPPLSDPVEYPRTLVHLCDVFVRRNTNETQKEEVARWSSTIETAREMGVNGAMGINAAWGSNWTGPFDIDLRMAWLEAQHRAWTDAGISVDRVWIGDPMGWNLPWLVSEQLRAIRDRWPEITTFHLHLHDARGMAMTSAYAALQTLAPEDTLILDSSVGGMGGCPYGGHGQMTRMIPTEDLVDMLEEAGVSTGVDRDALIRAALLAEEVVGHPLWGHVSHAGPRPRRGRLFPVDLPFIETPREALHFVRGAAAYESPRSPWTVDLNSPARDRVERGEPVPGPDEVMKELR